MSDFRLSCINQRKQRAQFFFHEGGTNSRFTPVCPYVKDSSGKLIYTPRDLDMRRKAEILKYVKPNNGNVSKNKYAQLATSTKKNRNKVICPNDSTPKPTSSSDVPGKIINLYEDPNVPLYNYFPLTEQFKFQNIKYDNFKRLFDIFPEYNVITNNGEYGDFTTIIILNPDTNQISFDFRFPISVQLSGDYNNNTYVTTEGEVQSIDASGNIVNIPVGTPYKVDDCNFSVIGATMEILYGDSILQTIDAEYSSLPTPLPTDLREALATDSILFTNSIDGPIESTQYLGDIYFKNVLLQSVSQYVYKIRIKLNISYAEYTNIITNNNLLPLRTNTDGNNIGNTNQKNITGVVYKPFLNILNDQKYVNTSQNCQSELFIDGEVTTPTYLPLLINSTSLKS